METGSCTSSRRCAGLYNTHRSNQVKGLGGTTCLKVVCNIEFDQITGYFDHRSYDNKRDATTL